MRWLSSLMGKFGQRGGGKEGGCNFEEIKKYLLSKNIFLCGVILKLSLNMYYKFCSKHVSIWPSLGGENGVEEKNIKIYEWHLKRRVL